VKKRSLCDDNIQLCLKETDIDDTRRMKLPTDPDKWWTFVWTMLSLHDLLSSPLVSLEFICLQYESVMLHFSILLHCVYFRHPFNNLYTRHSRKNHVQYHKNIPVINTRWALKWFIKRGKELGQYRKGAAISPKCFNALGKMLCEMWQIRTCM
jgi:hypothetical protein